MSQQPCFVILDDFSAHLFICQLVNSAPLVVASNLLDVKHRKENEWKVAFMEKKKWMFNVLCNSPAEVTGNQLVWCWYILNKGLFWPVFLLHLLHGIVPWPCLIYNWAWNGLFAANSLHTKQVSIIKKFEHKLW